ncbi:MAG: NAD-dependent epimerase/dehydratase family protein [Gaiellaceae bacterium MAG52_C11]|nr:NAD-dependent epimerase/dehydratase family protein [Candidatus Gaiellasilicea maunaloa]
MRIVVTGATGNVGTSVLDALGRDDAVASILGIARRPPAATFAKTEFAAADVTRDELASHLRGADCVIHLAWLIQPSHDEPTLRRTNVDGSQRLFEAVVAAGVPTLVVASSVGAYSPRTDQQPVDESWPTEGIPASWYSRQKAEVERRLDRLEAERPELRVVRLRPAITTKRDAASGQRRLFAGPLLPGALLSPGWIPFVPDVPGLTLQLAHADDVGDAYRRAALADVRGAFNIAAEPVLDPSAIARALGTRTLRLSEGILRRAAHATWLARLQPTSPDWLDLALGIPVLDTARARSELGWAPTRTADETLREVVAGIREGAGRATPPLQPGRHAAELRARVGGEQL